jgi:hypothetical protein
MNIYLNENGNQIDLLEERNKEIKENLDGVLQDFISEKNMLLAIKKQPKLGYRFMKMIMLELAKYPSMKLQDYIDLDYDTVNHYYIKFSELIAYYNRHFEIVDNKNIFMRYLGVDVHQYDRLEKHYDERIQQVMRMIDGDYVGLGWVASESGEADVKATTSRLRASGGAGHGVVSAVEEKALMQDDGMDEKEELAELARLGIKVVGEDRRLK